ncbi:MAG: hypothetical protein WBW71_08655, partial [Bacteroidota bacterium]
SMCEPCLPGYFASQYYEKTNRALEFVTGESLQTSRKWNGWLQEHSFDGIARLQSADLRKSITAYYNRYRTDPSKLATLTFIGFGPSVYDPSVTIDSLRWGKILDEVLEHSRFLTSVFDALVGSPENMARAKQYLVARTGKEFAWSDMYLAWWRKTYYNSLY